MAAIRRLLAQRHGAVLLCAATLLLRLLMPAGYMIGSDRGHVAVTLCTGTAPAMAGMRGAMPGHGRSGDHRKAEMPCAFAGLSAAMIGAADPVRLALPPAVVAAVGVAALLPRPPLAPARLRPPLRGPPARL